MPFRRFDNDGNQIVECADGFAYVWPRNYPDLKVGENVMVSDNPRWRGATSVVTKVGSELGGARGFVLARLGETK